MNVIDLIEKKKRGATLTTAEIDAFITGYTAGDIPDYQASALLMAIWFKGLSRKETFDLTMAMKNSGEVADLAAFGATIDKHSTGGIGDKLSLIVLPLWRAGGLKIAKMSGRGLGFTGGTIDKLESVPGFKTALSKEEFFAQLRRDGIVVAAQSGDLVPADKKLYALRDVTATVDSLPLIAASVMSKKLATAASVIVLDVKYGGGAFMTTRQDAAALAELMADLGRSDGRDVVALVSPMTRPLGYAVGNALEVAEAYACLCGEIGGELRRNALALAAAGFVAAGKAATMAQGLSYAKKLLADGDGAAAFLSWLKAQGGTFDDLPAALRYPCTTRDVTAASDGYVAAIDAKAIGLAAMALGAGRRELGDAIDPAAGIVLNCAVGDAVACGATLATLYGNGDFSAAAAVAAAITVTSTPPPPATDDAAVFDGKKWENIEIDHE